MKSQFIVWLLAIVSIVSCSSEETDLMPSGSQDPVLDIQFTNPPIDLSGVPAQFASDLAYDVYENTTFDVFMPSSSVATGLVIFIHGGGFTGGDKAFIYTDDYKEQVLELLSNGIAVASINYRLLEAGDNEGVLKSLMDSKRALQYIRYYHNTLNIDKNKIVLFGSSAGASTSLWLAANNDFSDPNNTDPILKESSRVKGVALRATQSSLDIETRWIGDVFAEFGTTIDDIIEEYGTDTIYNFYGVSSEEAYNTAEIEAYRQQVDMLGLLSSDDPEIWVNNTGANNEIPMSTGSFNHHPFHAREIKRFADAAGIPNVSTYGNPVIYSDPSNEDYVDFLIRKINE